MEERVIARRQKVRHQSTGALSAPAERWEPDPEATAELLDVLRTLTQDDFEYHSTECEHCKPFRRRLDAILARLEGGE